MSQILFEITYTISKNEYYYQIANQKLVQSYRPFFGNSAVESVVSNKKFGYAVFIPQYAFKWEIHIQTRKLDRKKMLEKIEDILCLIKKIFKPFPLIYYQIKATNPTAKNIPCCSSTVYNLQHESLNNSEYTICLRCKDLKYQEEYYFYFPLEMFPNTAKNQNALGESLYKISNDCLS